jgi:hypothetical protein
MKSLLSIKIDSVAIDDSKFDMWVENKLDMALGPCPAKNPHISAGIQPPMQDYLQMSRLLESMVGQRMMQFSQAMAMQATKGGMGVMGQGTTTPLESKGITMVSFFSVLFFSILYTTIFFILLSYFMLYAMFSTIQYHNCFCSNNIIAHANCFIIP